MLASLHETCPSFLPARQRDTGPGAWRAKLVFVQDRSLLEGTGREVGWRDNLLKAFLEGLRSPKNLHLCLAHDAVPV